MYCRPMTHFDLDAVIKIHQIAFKGFFLTRMGPRFLRAYYQAVLDFEANIALVACDTKTGRSLGFAVGFRDPRGFYVLFGHRRRQLLPTMIMAILRDPTLLLQILRNMRRIEARAQQLVDAVELSSIAVGAPGSGVGGALLEAFASQARDGLVQTLVLTTDVEGNEVARQFYEARGFALDGYEDRGKRRLCRYVRTLG